MFSSYEAFALMAALLVLEHGVPQAKAEESRDVTAIAALGQLTDRNNDARAMLLIQDGTREAASRWHPSGR